MFNRFLDGFYQGVFWIIMILILVSIAFFTIIPTYLAVAYSWWWLLSYFLIIPIDCGILNVIF